MLLNSRISAYARCLAGKVCGLVRSTWGTSQGKLGARDRTLNTKVARRACARRAPGKHSPSAGSTMCLLVTWSHPFCEDPTAGPSLSFAKKAVLWVVLAIATVPMPLRLDSAHVPCGNGVWTRAPYGRPKWDGLG